MRNLKLGDRMKEFYENVPKTSLTRRTPVIVRIDGKAFHTFTRGFAKPFDKCLMESMQETTLDLCNSVQGCVFGYTQSDEISLVLVDYFKFDTEAFFGYEVQKICSICASMATLYFNRHFSDHVAKFLEVNYEKVGKKEIYGDESERVEKLVKAYEKAMKIGGMFDARCFNLPKEEVANYILWRQQDATRNSIFGLGQAFFSPKKLHGKNTNEIQDMLITTYNINWNNYPTPCKRGTSVIKDDGKYVIDKDMPIIKGDDRAYVEKCVIFETEEN